jgi:hypothetical protein
VLATPPSQSRTFPQNNQISSPGKACCGTDLLFGITTSSDARWNGITLGLRSVALSFPRNEPPKLTEYIGERPADFAKATTAKEVRKAKTTTKRKIKYEKSKR